MSPKRHVTESLEEAGFSEAQIQALMNAFTLHHHSHPIDEIIGLEDQLDELGVEVEDGDDDDDE